MERIRQSVVSVVRTTVALCKCREVVMQIPRVTSLGALASLTILAFGFSASAAPVTVLDTYYGGLNTYNNNPPTSGDVIGSSIFDISSAVLTRTGNNLEVVINTNYVQNIGDSGTGLGALFLGNGTPTYNNAADSSQPITAPYYAYDEFSANPSRFQYAVGIPTNPTTTSGLGTLYALNGTGSDVQLSNDNGNTVAYPINPTANSYFRMDQAVGVNNTAQTLNPLLGVSATWSIGSGTLTFEIINAFALLSDNFTFAWAETCANDVILASTTLTSSSGGGTQSATPLPAALPLFATGLGALGLLARRKKRKGAAALAAA